MESNQIWWLMFEDSKMFQGLFHKVCHCSCGDVLTNHPQLWTTCDDPEQVSIVATSLLQLLSVKMWKAHPQISAPDP